MPILITWDADNKPVSITRSGVGTTEFPSIPRDAGLGTGGYSGDGARVKKIGPERTIRYVGAYEDHITEAVQIKHISAGRLRVATKVIGGINAGTYPSTSSGQAFSTAITWAASTSSPMRMGPRSSGSPTSPSGRPTATPAP